VASTGRDVSTIGERRCTTAIPRCSRSGGGSVMWRGSSAGGHDLKDASRAPRAASPCSHSPSKEHSGIEPEAAGRVRPGAQVAGRCSKTLPWPSVSCTSGKFVPRLMAWLRGHGAANAATSPD
jgi:hypothetical protein